MPDRESLKDRLAARIAAEGPIGVDTYMVEANAHYYATRDPFGVRGDFITAPEISQMFGELIGLWLADLWDRAGRPGDALYVELGPGRGTLAADALRAMNAAGLEPEVHLIETSPTLKAAQAERVPAAVWHDELEGLPEGRPLLVVANEFFDALPVRQFVKSSQGWHERGIAFEQGEFRPVAGAPVPLSLAAPEGSIVERSPATEAMAGSLARRLVAQGGAALIIDYGHERSALGDTIQAVRNHAFADPWQNAGEQDLTAHVDFETLGRAAGAAGARIFGPIAQGVWLTAMGIELRAVALSRSAPSRAAEFGAARHRLTDPDQMGRLFKALALTAPDWPVPAAF